MLEICDISGVNEGRGETLGAPSLNLLAYLERKFHSHQMRTYLPFDFHKDYC